MNNFKKLIRFSNLLRKQTIAYNQSFRSISVSPAFRSERISIAVEMDGKRFETTCETSGVLRDVIAKFKEDIGEDYGVCGGTMACSTCHVFFSESDFAKIGSEPSEEELDVLDTVPDFTETSRLACSVFLKPELDGITVKVPSIRADARSTEATEKI